MAENCDIPEAVRFVQCHSLYRVNLMYFLACDKQHISLHVVQFSFGFFSLLYMLFAIYN